VNQDWFCLVIFIFRCGVNISPTKIGMFSWESKAGMEEGKGETAT